MAEHILIHHKLDASKANGPGNRAVIWVQGCTLNCPGCFNPKTHDKNEGTQTTVNELFNWLLSLGNSIEGVTISGGEPLQQLKPVLSLLQRIKAETILTTFMFSGYTKKEIETFPQWLALSQALDMLLCGRYDVTHKLESCIVSSSNQEVLFLTNAYTQFEVDNIPHNEIIILPNGAIVASGVGGINLE
ncbi:MAG: radical SAM protein [Anaerolineaceae bacterium]|nr:radical SAM protein [Anaerolineaceae bacterium]